MPEAGTTSGGATVYGGTGAQGGGNTGSTAGSATGTPSGLPSISAYVPTLRGTQGWYITAAIATSVAFANTQAGPILLGILSLALIYQFGLLLQHK